MDHELELSKNYWDCECVDNYIQPVSQNHCNKCGANQESQPPSRVRELKEACLEYIVTKKEKRPKTAQAEKIYFK